MSKVAKRKPSRSPNVAEEKARKEKPLSRRSAKTMTRPRTIPRMSPGHRFCCISAETVAPINAQNVTNRTRNRFTVMSGVISVLRFDDLVWFVRGSSYRFWRRCHDRTAHRVLADYLSAHANRSPDPDLSESREA